MTIKFTAAHAANVDKLQQAIESLPLQLQILAKPMPLNKQVLKAYAERVIAIAAESESVRGEDIRPSAILKDVALFQATKGASVDTEMDVLASGVYAVPSYSRQASNINWPVKGIYPGVVALMGATASGKSKYSAEVLKPDVLIRWGEPTEEYDANANVVHVATLDELLVAALVLGGLGLRVVCDSIRPLLFRLKGAASAGGVVAVFYSLLTDLSNVCSFFDATVVMVVNPMVEAEKLDTVYSQVSASTVGAIMCANGAVSRSTFRTAGGRIFDQRTQPVAEESLPDMREPTALTGLDRVNQASVMRMDAVDVSDSELDRTPRKGASFNL